MQSIPAGYPGEDLVCKLDEVMSVRTARTIVRHRATTGDRPISRVRSLGAIQPCQQAVHLGIEVFGYRLECAGRPGAHGGLPGRHRLGEDRFRLLQGADALSDYRARASGWPEGHVHHYFCRHCGVRVFGHGTDTPMGEMYGVNVGCINGLTDEDLARLAIVRVDGLHDQWQQAPAHSGYL